MSFQTSCNLSQNNNTAGVQNFAIYLCTTCHMLSSALVDILIFWYSCRTVSYHNTQSVHCHINMHAYCIMYIYVPPKIFSSRIRLYPIFVHTYIYTYVRMYFIVKFGNGYHTYVQCEIQLWQIWWTAHHSLPNQIYQIFCKILIPWLPYIRFACTYKNDYKYVPSLMTYLYDFISSWSSQTFITEELID